MIEKEILSFKEEISFPKRVEFFHTTSFSIKMTLMVTFIFYICIIT